MQPVTPPHFREALEKAIDKAGSQMALAAAAGVSQPHVSECLTGQKKPLDALLEAMGWERVETYRRRRSAAR